MSLRLLLLRHAETHWNRERRYQGWTDTDLSDVGRAQAEAASRLLARQPLAAVWSSPLRRARETAAIIAAAQGLVVKESAAFMEMRFGDWEGLTVAEIGAQFPDAYAAWRDTPHLTGPAGAEPLDDVRRRVVEGLGELRRAHDGETICLVAHGVPVRVLILEALGLPLDRIWSIHASPTGVSELEFRADWTALHRMNTLAHLEGVPSVRQ
jgi:broad specificity phosphatase PhoE